MATKTIVVLAIAGVVAVTASSMAVAQCSSHAWHQTIPQDRTLHEFYSAQRHEGEVLAVREDQLASALSRLASSSFVVVSAAEAATLTGASHLKEYPEPTRGQLVLFRALRDKRGGEFSIYRLGSDVLISFGSLGSAGAVEAWPVVAQLKELPARVFLNCSGAH